MMVNRSVPRRRQLARLALLLASATATACGTGRLRPDEPASNLVLIVIDTLRADHLECYGYSRRTAPTLCGLAGEGAQFDALSPSSWTKPATASLLTGLHPIRHQAIDRNDRLPGGALTLAEILSRRGFSTVAVSANGWISERFGFAQGFDTFHLEPQSDDRPVPAGELNRIALPLLDELREPYFLYLHYVDPHAPYDPPAAWNGEPLDERLAAVAPMTNDDLDMAAFVDRDPQQLADAIDLYDGEIREVDRRIGELLSALGERQLLDRTLTVVTSDHGEEFQEHGRVGHGMNLYGEVTRVPLIFHAPRSLEPAGDLGSANLVDVPITVLELLDVEVPEEELASDGRSLLAPLLQAPETGLPPREHLLHQALDERPSLALVTADRKLVLSKNPYRKELFDLTEDAGEQHNLLVPDGGSPVSGGGSGDAPWTLLADNLAGRYNLLQQRALERETVEDAGEVDDSIRALGYVAPTVDSIQPRILPHRLRAADGRAGGLLGWERLDELAGCVEVAAPEAERQLLASWRYPELGGRWTLPDATLILSVPDWQPPGADPAAGPTAYRLSFLGTNYRPDSFTLRAWLDGRPILDQEVPPGTFEVEAMVPGNLLDAPRALVRVAGAPPFEPPPSQRRRRWLLGTHLTSVCLAAVEPAGATAGSPAP